MQSDLNVLHLWCRDNLLEINASKTKSMFFNSKYLNSSSKPRQKLSLGKAKLDWVFDYKYLGVTIDTSLTLNKHVKNIIKNVSFRLHKLRRIRKFLSKRTTLQLYKCMLLPIFDYGDLFYNYCSVKLLRKLQILQNRSIRLICGVNKTTNTYSLQAELGLLPLEYRRNFHTIQFAHCLSCNSNLIELNRQRTITRLNNPNRRQFKMLRPTKAVIEKGVSFRIRKAWNNLPTQVHVIDNKNDLKNLLLVTSTAIC